MVRQRERLRWSDGNDRTHPLQGQTTRSTGSGLGPEAETFIAPADSYKFDLSSDRHQQTATAFPATGASEAGNIFGNLQGTAGGRPRIDVFV